MKRYERYKPSGIEWIGEIPEHWDLVLLKRKLDGLKDGTHGTYSRTNKGKPLLSAKNVYFDGIKISENESLISEEDHDEIVKNGYPQYGDLLLTIVGTIGRCFVYNLEYPLAFQRSVLFLRFKKRVNPKYYYYFFQSPLFSNRLLSLAKTSAQSGVYMNDVAESIVLELPKQEQTAIANYLDQKTTQIDDLIAKKEKLIDLLNAEKTAIINQAVTKGLNPEAPTKDSGIPWMGEIPAHWGVKKLRYLASKVGSGITPLGGASVYQTSGVPLLRSQNIHFDGLMLDDVAYISEEIDEEMSNSRIAEGDVLLNITGASVGRCYFVDGTLLRGNVNQHVCIIRPIISRIKTMYLYYLFRSYMGQQQIVYSTSGANREGLNFEQIKAFTFGIPDLEEQIKTIEFLQKGTEKINNVQAKIGREIGLLQEYRTALISEAVTGKIKVS